MVQEESVNRFMQAVNNLNFDEPLLLKLYRENLGDASLKPYVTTTMRKIESRIQLVKTVLNDVSNDRLNSFSGYLEDLANEFNAQSNYSTETEFVMNKDDFMIRVDEIYENILEIDTYFATVALHSRGILDELDLLRQSDEVFANFKKDVENLKRDTENSVKTIVQNAKAESEAIVIKARDTAGGVSLEQAQLQFKKAKDSSFRQLVLWGLSSASLVGLFTAVLWNLFFLEFENGNLTELIFFITLRIAALGLIVSLLAYFLGLFKSTLHQFQHSQHRLLITNCIGTFIESIIDKDQRDYIFRQLIDEVATFGDSGLIKSSNSNARDSNTKVVVERIDKSLGKLDQGD